MVLHLGLKNHFLNNSNVMRLLTSIFFVLFIIYNGNAQTQNQLRLGEIERAITKALTEADYGLAAELKKEKEIRLEIETALKEENYDLAEQLLAKLSSKADTPAQVNQTENLSSTNSGSIRISTTQSNKQPVFFFLDGKFIQSVYKGSELLLKDVNAGRHTLAFHINLAVNDYQRAKRKGMLSEIEIVVEPGLNYEVKLTITDPRKLTKLIKGKLPLTPYISVSQSAKPNQIDPQHTLTYGTVLRPEKSPFHAAYQNATIGTNLIPILFPPWPTSAVEKFMFPVAARIQSPMVKNTGLITDFGIEFAMSSYRVKNLYALNSSYYNNYFIGIHGGIGYRLELPFMHVYTSITGSPVFWANTGSGPGNNFSDYYVRFIASFNGGFQFFFGPKSNVGLFVEGSFNVPMAWAYQGLRVGLVTRSISPKRRQFDYLFQKQ